ncbi:MAG: RluA family pseudouridine synthase [Clostridiales bacterium]|nr:RluA family pseudouridine synthase [Clostridiales bacterium]
MLNVIYEDNHILVVIKPQNIPTQADITGDTCMVDMVESYLREKYNKPGNVYVGLVHRLDRPTGGLMIFAKTDKAAKRLSESIKTKDFEKMYLTVVNGEPRDKVATLTNYLKKSSRDNMVRVVPELTTGAKYAELSYETLEVKEKVSLVRVNLVTGRSHQIRVQMKHIGHPVYGDVRYGGDILAKGHNLALWSYKIRFIHPTTKQTMTFISLPPEDLVPWSAFNFKNIQL